MQVHAQAVGGLDGRQLVVVLVKDHALALAGPVVGVALEPGEYRLSVEVLHTEVGYELLARDGKGIKPEQVTGRVEDHRPVLDGSELRSHEDVPLGGGRRVLAHPDRGRKQVGAGVEVLEGVRPVRDPRERSPA